MIWQVISKFIQMVLVFGWNEDEKSQDYFHTQNLHLLHVQ